MKQKDITIYYPVKCNGKYEPLAYSFLGTISSFSNIKDAFDIIKSSFLTREECQDKCNSLNDLLKINNDFKKVISYFK